MRVQNAINRYGASRGDFAVVTERDGEMVTLGAHWWVDGELKQKVVEEIEDLDVDLFIQLKGMGAGCPDIRLNERNYGPIR